MATNIIQTHFRPSDLLLDRVLNPTRNGDLGNALPAELIEACGTIPDFFCNACLGAFNELGPRNEPITLQDVADRMDSEYQYGGFRISTWRGSVDANGVYQSEHEEDADLFPLARFGFEGRFFCYVYDYGVAAIVDRTNSEFMVARFD